ncbi:hypothetical protein [Sphingomonas sp. CLY1604]
MNEPLCLDRVADRFRPIREGAAFPIVPTASSRQASDVVFAQAAE